MPNVDSAPFIKLPDGTYVNMDNLSHYAVQEHSRADGTKDAEVVLTPVSLHSRFKVAAGCASKEEAQAALDDFMSEIGYREMVTFTDDEEEVTE